MNHRFWFLCFVCLPILVSCQQAPDPHSILKKAIAAHGGAKNIAKPRMGMLKATNKEGDITQEEFFDLPKRWKRTTVGTFKDEKRTSFNLMIDGKFWECDE